MMIVRCLLESAPSTTTSPSFTVTPTLAPDVLNDVAAAFDAVVAADERLTRRVRALVQEDRARDAVVLLETILEHRFDTATAKLLAELHLASGAKRDAKSALRVLRGCQITCPNDAAMLGLVRTAFQALDHRLAVHALDEEIARVAKSRA
jgi:hypothetical protein